MSKYVHSSTKLAALEMTYWRNDLLFLYFPFIVFSVHCIFNCDTSHWFLYVPSVRTTSSLQLFLISFTEYSAKAGLKI